MTSFFFSYCLVVSVLGLIGVCLGVWWWKMVYVGRWAVIGGLMVPAVARVFDSVVRVTSMRVFEL